MADLMGDYYYRGGKSGVLTTTERRKMKTVNVTNVDTLRQIWLDYHTKSKKDSPYRPFACEFVAYRFTEADGRSYNFAHTKPTLTTVAGGRLLVMEPDYNMANDCGAGVNVGTLKWVLGNASKKHVVWKIKFMLHDIAALPFRSEGKFRLRTCAVMHKVATSYNGYRHVLVGPLHKPKTVAKAKAPIRRKRKV